jgi:hypothetical protein
MLHRLKIQAHGAIRRDFRAEWHGRCNNTSQRKEHQQAREPIMTPITHTARNAESAPITAALTTGAAEQLLRDVAYVLKLTRRVKEEMTADRAPTQTRVGRNAVGVLVA